MRIIPDHRFNDDEAKGKAGEETCYDAQNHNWPIKYTAATLGWRKLKTQAHSFYS